MSGWEIALLVSVAGIFILVVRRLPQALNDLRDNEPLAPFTPQVDAETDFSVGDEAVVSSPKPTKTKGRKSREEVVSLPSDEALVVISDDEAEFAYRAHDYPTAALMYESLLKENPTKAPYYTRLGQIYLELERFHDARDIFRTALKFGDQVASRHANIAMAEYGLGHRLTAVRYMRRAVALAPANQNYLELLETFENDRSS